MRKPVLTDAEVTQVIKKYKSGAFMRELAKEFNVSNTTIKNYLKRNNITLRNPNKEMSRYGKTRILDKNPFWNGGKTKRPDGYVMINIGGNNRMLEHRYVLEQKLGRKLKDNEVAHHINGIKHDNRPENLEVMTLSNHSIYHGKQRIETKTHNSYKHISKRDMEILLKQGKTRKEITKKYEISDRTFYNKLDKLNLRKLYEETKKHA